MRKLVILAGKSACGKDTVLRRLIELFPNKYTNVVSHTTRPIRPNERDGSDYYFVSEREIEAIPMVETRVYQTAYGEWVYGLSEEEIILKLNSGLIPIVILDLDGAMDLSRWIRDTFDDIQVYRIAICASTILRLWRSWKRVGFKLSALPEIIRRLIADSKDFSDSDKVCRYTIENANGCLDSVVDSVNEVVG